MTPLELQLEGFTVYRQHTKVDFSGADTALFAVTGPTGAGKSTLLDAITYVLYGKTARLGGRGLGGLISPGAEALFAQLTFRTARGVYRATRVAQRRSAGVGTEVRMEVAGKDGMVHPVSYTMVKIGDRWLLRNVIIEGINLGKLFRDQFGEAMQRNRNNLDAVIDNWVDSVARARKAGNA